MKPLPLQSLAVLALVMNAAVVGAQCDFDHAGQAKQYRSDLVPVFFPCDIHYTNDETEGGLPSCSPPQTDAEQAGSSPAAWHWNRFFSAQIARGSVQLKAVANRVVSPLNPRGDTADVKVKLRLKNITDGSGALADGTGRFFVLMRVTTDDRAGGDMTLIDLPVQLPFTLRRGKVTLSSSFNLALNGDGQPGLPPCSNIEVLSLLVYDPLDNWFASAGLFVPPRPDDVCDFESAQKSAKTQASFVPVFVGCETFDGRPANATSEGGFESCAPPLTPNERIGSPSNGWIFDTPSSKASIKLGVDDEPSALPPGVLNPSGQTGDVPLRLTIVGIRTPTVWANGTGTLTARARITVHDRQGTPSPGDDVSMTVGEPNYPILGFPLELPFTLVEGSVDLQTSVDAILNAMGHPGLPHCASIDLLDVTLRDLNGTEFARLGTWLAP